VVASVVVMARLVILNSIPNSNSYKTVPSTKFLLDHMKSIAKHIGFPIVYLSPEKYVYEINDIIYVVDSQGKVFQVFLKS